MAYYFHNENQTLNPQTRSQLPGQFIDLPDGTVHFEISGPENGQTVFLIHGFAVPYFIWDKVFPALAGAGFRVIRYDLYGCGFSDRPDMAYDTALFDRQLFELAERLHIQRPFDLIGMSLGGAIASTFTDRHADLVRRLVLIDPYVGSLRQSLGENIVKLPIIGEIIMDRFGSQMILDTLPADFYRPELFPEYQANHRPQMAYAGFKRAIISTLRNNRMGVMRGFYQRVGRTNRPILLVWGCEDHTIPFKNHSVILEAIPGIEFHPIEKAGHVPHYERPDVVNPILFDFLTRK